MSDGAAHTHPGERYEGGGKILLGVDTTGKAQKNCKCEHLLPAHGGISAPHILLLGYNQATG